MEVVFINHIIQSIGDGNYEKGLFNILVFLVLYLQIKGLKTEVKAVNNTVEKGFQAGETRFQNIETRLTRVEQVTHPLGG